MGMEIPPRNSVFVTVLVFGCDPDHCNKIGQIILKNVRVCNFLIVPAKWKPIQKDGDNTVRTQIRPATFCDAEILRIAILPRSGQHKNGPDACVCDALKGNRTL